MSEGWMRRRIRSEVTVETESLWMIRWRGRLAHTRCVVCAGDATLISLDEAVALSRTSSRGLHRLPGFASAGALRQVKTMSDPGRFARPSLKERRETAA